MATREQLTDLLARVEGATEPSIHLFFDVARATYPDAYPAGWIYDQALAEWRFLTFQKFVGICAWESAALALLGRVLPGWSWSLRSSPGEFTRASVWRSGEVTCVDAIRSDNQSALAILSAMLRALIAEMTDDR